MHILINRAVRRAQTSELLKRCCTYLFLESGTTGRQTKVPSQRTHAHTLAPTHTHTDSRPLQVTHLEVPVYHPHLMAVEHSLQDLLDAMTARKQQGEQVSLRTFRPHLSHPCRGSNISIKSHPRHTDTHIHSEPQSQLPHSPTYMY